MSKTGIWKGVVSVTILALSVLLLFQDWISIRDQDVRDAVSEGLSSGKSTVERILEDYLGVNASGEIQEMGQSEPVQNIRKTADDTLDKVKDILSFSPLEISHLLEDLSKNMNGLESVFGEIPIVNSRLSETENKLHVLALILRIWFYGILGSAVLALIGIVADRSLYILPYPVLVCTYIWFIQQRLSHVLASLPGAGKLFGYTLFAYLCAALSVLLLLVSILVRDRKRLAARKEARRIRNRGY